MPKSILDAVKMGLWDYEPPAVPAERFDRTDAMPGSRDKLETLAERIRLGLPLWHPQDRDELDESEFKRDMEHRERQRDEERYELAAKPR